MCSPRIDTATSSRRILVNEQSVRSESRTSTRAPSVNRRIYGHARPSLCLGIGFVWARPRTCCPRTCPPADMRRMGNQLSARERRHLNASMSFKSRVTFQRARFRRAHAQRISPHSHEVIMSYVCAGHERFNLPAVCSASRGPVRPRLVRALARFFIISHSMLSGRCDVDRDRAAIRVTIAAAAAVQRGEAHLD